jgi:hypothetical protein
MTKIANGESLTWVHIGDLHITDEAQPNYREFLAIIDTIGTQLVGDVDFCVLPGDDADDGSPIQYALIRRFLDVVSSGSGGPDVALGQEQLAWLEAELITATRSTGQIEEGPVGFSLVSLNGGVVSWRFKPLRTAWPFVMMTSPVDYRLVTDVTRPEHDRNTWSIN